MFRLESTLELCCVILLRVFVFVLFFLAQFDKRVGISSGRDVGFESNYFINKNLINVFSRYILKLLVNR